MGQLSDRGKLFLDDLSQMEGVHAKLQLHNLTSMFRKSGYHQSQILAIFG